MLGYFKDPERTAEVIADGWLHTGDIVRIDAEGNLFFYDRLKDMIKTGGMNVSSQEVERVLHQHPDVLRAAVVGLPDDYWSEARHRLRHRRRRAPSRSRPSSSRSAGRRLAAYKTPKAVHVVDDSRSTRRASPQARAAARCGSALTQNA